MTPPLPPAPGLNATSASLNHPVVSASASRPPVEKTDDEKLLERAQEQFRQIASVESMWRRKAVEELNFVDGLQHWTPEMIEERKGRPCLTFDRISPSIDQVINDMRRNPPEPKVSPVGGGTDKETAEIVQGIIRNIEQDTDADIACMTGYEHAVKIGRGWWRILTEYETGNEGPNGELSADLFQQKIVYKRVSNPFSVYPDPAADAFDYSDMRFCFVTEDLSKDVFDSLYGDRSALGTMAGGFTGVGDTIRADWFPDNCIRVAEYWWVETSEERIALLSDGSVVLATDVAGRQVIGTRTREKRTVHGAKITGTEVLDRWEWPGKWIPIVPCIGREIIHREGRKGLRGMIRAAMDPNLSYDYMRSKQVEAVGLAPIAPWIIAEGQLEGYEDLWKNANRKAEAFLPYKHIAEGGTPLPAPQRNTAEPAIQAITVAVAHADNDIKATLSTYDASLGSPGPEQSGRAILARQREGDNAHFGYHDNLARSMRHTCRIIVDLIPHIYTEERVMTIFDPDGSMRQVTINAPTKIADGVERIFKIGKMYGIARYDITVGSGPSYASRRAEGSAALMQLAQAMPELMGSRAMDLVVRSLDIPNGDELAARLRPPDLPNPEDGQNLPPAIQQKLAQSGQMIDQLTQALNAQTEVLKTKVLELESAERIATLKEDAANWRALVVSKNSQLNNLAVLDHAAVEHRVQLREDRLQFDKTLEQEAAQMEADAAAAQAQKQPAQQ